MHPPLAHKHKLCEDKIKELMQCHNDSKWTKYLGHCNQVKLDLDNCLTEEYHTKRAENAKRAQEMQAKYDNLVKELNS